MRAPAPAVALKAYARAVAPARSPSTHTDEFEHPSLREQLGSQQSFYAPLEVVSVEGKGRGVVARRDLAAGQLLLASAPLAIVEGPALQGPATGPGGAAPVVAADLAALLSRSRLSRRQSRLLDALFSGGELWSPVTGPQEAEQPRSAALERQDGGVAGAAYADATGAAAAGRCLQLSSLSPLAEGALRGVRRPDGAVVALAEAAEAAFGRDGVAHGAAEGLPDVVALQYGDAVAYNCYGEPCTDRLLAALLGPQADGGGSFVGLWADFAMLNHSCCPNTTNLVGGPRRRMLVRATQPIAAGEEPQLPNLVVVRTNRLEVYSVRASAAPAAGMAATTAAGSGGPSVGGGGARLELVCSEHLHGVVESMAVLSGGSPGRRDALLLTFRDAKLSVLEWDPRSARLRTSSLHYFEGEGEGAILRAAVQGGAGRSEGLGGRAAVPLPPRVVADPAGRCAAVAVLFNQLALLPALEADALDLGGGGGGVACVGNSYMLNLQKMMGIREVRDCVFLHGYTEPVLLLLHESDPTWAGRLRERKDTCCLTAISISLRLKRHTLLWKVGGLPYDSYQLLAVPYRPAVLVISPNLIVLSSQASQHAAALNSNALPGEAPPPLMFDPAREHPATTAGRMASEFALNVHPDCAPAAGRSAAFMADLEAVAAGAAAAWLTPTTCIMGLQSGSLLAVHLRFEGPPDQRITAVRTGGGPVASAMVGLTMAAAARAPAAALVGGPGGGAAAAAAAAAGPLASYRGPKGLIFLGSWTGDSALMQLRPRAAGVEVAGRGEGKRPGKRRQEGGDGSGDGADGEGGDGVAATNKSAAVAAAAAAFAASAAAADAAGCALRYNLRLLDSLPSIGPVRDLLFADTSVSSYCSGGGGGPDASRGGPTTFLCVGQGPTGAIVMCRQGVLPDVVTEVGLPGVAGAFAVHHRTEDDDTAVLLAEAPPTGPEAGPEVEGAEGEGEEAEDGGVADAGERPEAMEVTPEPPDVPAPAERGAAAASDGNGQDGGGGAVAVKAEGPGDGSEEPEASVKAEPGDEPSGAGRARSPSPKRSDPDPGVEPAGGGALVPAGEGAQGAAPAARPPGPPPHAYLLLTLGRSRTMVLKSAEGLEDVTGSHRAGGRAGGRRV
ncbi:hypothetical protein GPECTOR_80g175 [Gonium pectorale]|uniref:SET domain-containing protein n=1 Tax=Gonium pectorale TaxID=33097 RepID=A0A150G2S7_GONPE|nr:hypothetical protein GPECTOR_80g175 [Gonium pectorale]|eukprot:KXZ43815.1 hypothetical protein GPECTOR_80g175 [Gonium pectorale]